MPLAPPSSHSPQTRVFTLATDPNTFLASQVIYLGGPAVWQMEMSNLVVVPDGETFAPADDPQPGELFVDLRSFRQSLDGITWFLAPIVPYVWIYDKPGDQATTQFAAYGFGPRYLQFWEWRIIDSDTFEVYAGPNHPTATATFTLTYN